ncbi:MAG: hypothetical protein H0V89_06690 [Deltaproteobacteria bacterium]|nr:hypothetical protein [Deltaproteobacteria bacterium]
MVLPIDGPADLTPIPADDGLPERWPPGSRADITGCSGGPESWSPYQAIADRSGVVTFPAVVVVGDSLSAGMRKPPGLPVTGYYARPQVRPHLEYAGTWFSIGGVLLLIWVYAGFRRASDRRNDQNLSAS